MGKADMTGKIALTHLVMFLCFCSVLYGERGNASSIHMKDVVILKDDEIRVSYLVAPADKRLDTAVLSLDPDSLHIIPSRVIRDALRPPGEPVGVIVGRHTAVVPRRQASMLGPGFAEGFCRFLLSEVYDRDVRAEVEINGSPVLPDGKAGERYSFRFLKANRVNGNPWGEAIVEYAYADASGEAARFNLFIRFRLFIPAFKAHRDIEAGGQITVESLTASEAEISPFTEALLPVSRNPGQYIARTVINKNEFIRMRNLSKRIDVRAGDEVVIIIKKGTIRLTMSGTACNSGSIGDEIRVRPHDSGIWLDAAVTGEKEVRIGI
ncbi:MAG: flagellar basal body P-ring formation protein FlgA [Spirochaetales bacterium]|nr:flagellar basal body P-ring formation protein FlgA [Spirochaetales bacterium]